MEWNIIDTYWCSSVKYKETKISILNNSKLLVLSSTLNKEQFQRFVYSLCIEFFKRPLIFLEKTYK